MQRKRSPWEREYQEVWRKEQWFLRQYDEKAESALEQKVSRLAPEKLMESLHGSFEKAFAAVFERGDGIIRRAGRQEARRETYQAQEAAVNAGGDRAALKAFSRAAGKAGIGNLAVSGAAGIGMGFLGVMLPDIPLFTAMVLKSVYETAESYGFPSEEEAEQLYALRVVEAALSWGGELREKDRALDTYAQTGAWVEPVNREAQIRRTARKLSEAMLYGKALQNVPVAGAVGGAADAVCLNRIQRYANIKYHKRFLIRRRLAE